MRVGNLSTCVADPTLTPTPLPVGEGLKSILERYFCVVGARRSKFMIALNTSA
jgi:hypothetical protein